MTERMWVDQVRQLLVRAKTEQSVAFSNLQALKGSIDGALSAAQALKGERQRGAPLPPPYPIQRRNLLAQIAQKGRYYGLSDEIQAFVYAANAQVIQELDNDQLGALHAWLTQWVENMHSGCDSAFAPPAR